MKIKKIAGHLLYGIIGLVFMNAVLSLVVNPYIGNLLGAANQGRILFFTSISTLLANSFGSGANYARMKIYADERSTENGEYNVFLILSSLLIAVIAVVAILIKGDSADATWIGIISVFILTSTRVYADVEFRLNLNYKRFMFFYLLIGIGYLLGFLIFYLTRHWVFIYIVGESFGLIYVAIVGKIFRKPLFKKTENYKKHMRIMWTISGSFILSDFVASADRMMLALLMPANGDEMTSIFYYASLVGKLMSLLSAPLNGVISGHIAKSEKGLTKKMFLKLTGLMFLLFVVVTGLAFLGSNIFVYLFYPAHYAEAKPLFLLANAGQVIFFICNTMMVIVLRYTSDKIQVLVSVIYIVLFFAISIPLILNFGLFGMAWGILIANVLKFLLYAGLGLVGLKKGNVNE